MNDSIQYLSIHDSIQYLGIHDSIQYLSIHDSIQYLSIHDSIQYLSIHDSIQYLSIHDSIQTQTLLLKHFKIIKMTTSPHVSKAFWAKEKIKSITIIKNTQKIIILV